MATEKNKNIRVHRNGNAYFLHDAALIEDATDMALFDRVDNRSAENQLPRNTAIGRGSAIFFKYNNLSLICKHYQRGGFIAKLLHDHYFGIKPEGSRAFREWRLLDQMQQLGLPAPVPVVARVLKNGLLYKADMIMKEIEGAETLADMCLKSGASDEVWFNVGKCIKQFHDNDVYHADLNARNILVAEEDRVYLIDFDKGCFRESSDSWKASNLSRLNRSLVKFKNLNTVFHYTQDNWNLLLDGYNS